MDDPSLLANRPWWAPLAQHKVRTGAAALVGLLALVAIVPPLRSAAAFVASRAILVVTTPFAPSVDELDTAPQASKVVAADGSLLASLEEGERVSVRLADLPDHVKHAVLAAEDADFYRHDGVDPTAIVRAALNMAQGSGTQGGSTITQQVAKLNYTTGERTWFRKLREVLYATRLERDYSKDQILERYLNQVYLGDGAYGIEAGARKTYAVKAFQLTPEQAAALAVRVRAPKRYDPRGKAAADVLDRRNRVLAAMASRGWLPKEELAARQAVPLQPVPLPPGAGRSEGEVVARALRELAGEAVLGGTADERQAKLEGGGLTIETTLDPKGQAAARAAAAKALPAADGPSAAVVSVQPGDGAIRVLVGDSRGGQFDVATQGRRQPGSSFKPFTYVAALESSIHPGTTYDSKSPQTFQFGGSPFTVKNAEEGTGGPMSLEDATVRSVNVVYTQVALQVGPAKVRDVARRFGHPDDLAANPAIALGGLREGVSPLDQAAAYGVFASGGTYATPYLVARVRDPQGRVVWEHERATRKAAHPEQAGVVNAVLQRVVAEGTGRAASIGRPVAGKTGTTDRSVDAWFVGYTPQLATAVWVGFPDGARSMEEELGRPVFGGGPPAQVFAATMRAALAGQPATPLPVATPDQLGLRPPGGATTTLPPAPPASDPVAPPPEQTTVPTAPPSTVTVPVEATTSTTTAPCPTTTTSSSATSTTSTTRPGGRPTTTSTTRPPGC